jgi:HPr kinase/phosphorylase
LPYEPSAVVGLVVDLAAADAERLPETDPQCTVIAGVKLPRLAVAAGQEALPAVLTLLTSGRSGGAIAALGPRS